MLSTQLIMAAAGTPFYQDTKFYILVSLVLFFALLIWKGVFKALGKSLDDRAETIENELNEARRLREEAQALLASYHRKQKEAEQQAEDIVAQARRDAESMAKQARKDLAEKLERRAQAAEAKIASAEAKALAEVRSRAADMAVQAAENVLRSDLKAADHKKLVAEGIKQLSQFN